MKLDSHQHFWLYSPEQFAWITDEMAAIRRHFLPADLQPELQEMAFDGCIAVQAPQTLEENYFLLGLAEEYDFVKGVVGWVDLQAPDVADVLAQFAAQPKFAGVRHVVQAETDPQFMLRPAFLNGIRQLAAHRLTYDILIYARQLPMAEAFVRHFPGQPFVLDHIAKPDIKGGTDFEAWKTGIQQLAAHPNVCCKLSGMVTEADWQNHRPDDFRRYLDVVLESFTPQRLMIGSDWPVCLVSRPYEATMRLVADQVGTLTATEQARIMGDTAAAFYGATSF